MSDYKVVFDEDDEYKVEIVYDGEVVFTWYDDYNVDCPEDLCWHRLIGNVFAAGVRLGKQMVNGKETEKCN